MGLFLDFVTFGAWDFPTSVLLNFLALGLRTLRVFCTCVLLDLNFQTLGLGTLGFSGFSTFCFFCILDFVLFDNSNNKEAFFDNLCCHNNF